MRSRLCTKYSSRWSWTFPPNGSQQVLHGKPPGCGVISAPRLLHPVENGLGRVKFDNPAVFSPSSPPPGTSPILPHQVGIPYTKFAENLLAEDLLSCSLANTKEAPERSGASSTKAWLLSYRTPTISLTFSVSGFSCFSLGRWASSWRFLRDSSSIR